MNFSPWFFYLWKEIPITPDRGLGQYIGAGKQARIPGPGSGPVSSTLIYWKLGWELSILACPLVACSAPHFFKIIILFFESAIVFLFVLEKIMI